MRVARLMLRPLQQLWQLGDVCGDAPRFVAREQIGSGAPAGLVFKIGVCDREAVGVADDEAGVSLFGYRRWRKANRLRLAGI